MVGTKGQNPTEWKENAGTHIAIKIMETDLMG